MQYMLTGHRENQNSVISCFQSCATQRLCGSCKVRKPSNTGQCNLPFAHPDTSFSVSVLLVFVSFRLFLLPSS
ncbi:hypothetical protein NEUTE1DRAFT_118596 [Neurospora tetrasperma FGSC 2508]|uniref:Uncharacterized protein n=1 Tax=Neurospora tetrasperma (strain FGSC 2508 / ATCC MYA-4615 / P0657) TaxID=510951 RepID=F8MYX6_NEUT8|nr:uncharacterized protein NEUTE1DRAFT_118596 [Neurospora tetrasperma FGSC 2508]EGO51974.1 hypothetical protein NEUTE1DRAFT_118596 [Neurospora tetrasperma FGSC 2508]